MAFLTGGANHLLIGMIYQVPGPNGVKNGVTPSLKKIVPFLWITVSVTTLYKWSYKILLIKLTGAHLVGITRKSNQMKSACLISFHLHPKQRFEKQHILHTVQKLPA